MLETFYNTLGAQPISTKVGLEYITNGVREQPSADATVNRKHILERLTIFLGQEDGKAKYSTDSILKNFEVREAKSIKARYTYRDGRAVHQHAEVRHINDETDTTVIVRNGRVSQQRTDRAHDGAHTVDDSSSRHV